MSEEAFDRRLPAPMPLGAILNPVNSSIIAVSRHLRPAAAGPRGHGAGGRGRRRRRAGAVAHEHTLSRIVPRIGERGTTAEVRALPA